MKEIELKGEQDFTKELREAVSLKVDELHFTTGQDSPIWATGILPNDGDLIRLGHLGGFGILRIEGENRPLKISGKSKEDPTVIYTKAPAVPSLDLDGDGLNDSPFSAVTMSQRKYLRIEPSTNGFEAENFIFRGDNDTSQWKEGFPEYEANFEFEHAAQSGGSNITLRNLRAEYVRGDGFYINGGKNINILNCSIHWAGRQGGAVVAGENCFILDLNSFRIRRSDFDIEANGTHIITKDIFLIGGFSYAYLSGVPMGGAGQVSNVLVRERDFQWGSAVAILGNYSRGYLRKNIIIDGCRFRKASDGPTGPFKIIDAENVLIENVTDCFLSPRRTHIIASLRGTNTNVTIRNCNFENAKYIELRDGTKPENVTVYGVVQDLEFLFEDGSTQPVIQKQNVSEEENNSIPFEVSPKLYGRYYRDYEQAERDTEAPNFDKFDHIFLQVEYGVKGQVVEVKPTATDNSNKPVTIEQISGIKSGQIFPVGVHELIFRATDESGNSIDKTIGVTIEEKAYVDTIPPEFKPIEDMVFEIEHDADGKVVDFNIEATDNFDENVKIEQVRGLPSGSLFEADTAYHQEFRAIDASGNFTEMDFKIMINRKEAPVEKKDFVINKKVSFVNAKENIFSSTEMFLYHLSTEIPVSEISAKLIFSKDLEMFIQNFGEDKTMSIQAESDEYKYSITYEISKKEITPDPEPTPDEPPVVVDPDPEPITEPTPDKPIETDEEALDMAQKILDFLKKKSSLIGIGIIILIILLIILL